jgi:nucleoside-triphosphatase
VAALGVPAGGFYTQELRAGGRRLGFELITMDGRRAVLASVDSNSRHRVSRYGIEMAALHELGVPAIEEAAAREGLIVIDEIGKMELFSPRFRRAVQSALNSGMPVLATIMQGPHPFADSVKGRDDVELLVLTEANRNDIGGRVVSILRRLLGPAHSAGEDHRHP